MDFLESTSAWRTARRVLFHALARVRDLTSRLRSRLRSAGPTRFNQAVGEPLCPPASRPGIALVAPSQRDHR